MSSYVLLSAALWCAILAAGLLLSRIAIRSGRSSERGRLGCRLALGLWALTAACLLVEAGFALFYDGTDDLGSTRLSRRWTEEHVRLNNWGFRSERDFAPQPPAGTSRVLLLGDSFAFGNGVNDPADRFGDRLERIWGKGAARPLQVDNFALPGQSLRDQVEILEHLVRKLSVRADEVLLSYCLNDVEYLVPDQVGEIFTAVAQAPTNNPLVQHLYLPNLLATRLAMQRTEVWPRYVTAINRVYTTDLWLQHEQMLDRLAAVAREGNMTLRVVLWPYLSDLGEHYPFEPAHRRLADHLRLRHVPFLDLLETMRAHAGEELMVSRFDQHPNARAHALAASAIAEFFPAP